MAAILRKSGAQYVGALVLGFLLCGAAFAAPFTFYAQLTGDPRAANPDNLIIDVTVSGDDVSSTAVLWTVEINSPLHPNAKLGGFFFNVALPINRTLSFSEFDPVGWDADVGSNAPGGGGIDFDVGVAGQGNVDDVTSAQPLTFKMTLLDDNGNPVSGGFDPAILTGADFSCSNSEILGCGRLGAHLQSLSAAPGQLDSGFLLASNWRDEPFPPAGVPEPGSLALLGVALLGLAGFRRCRKS